MTAWDPARYLQYADERGRPFVDLVARVDADAPGRVVDLGCGPGNLTSLLADRWPEAAVVGIDSSAEMIAAATDDRIEWRVQDLRAWIDSGETADVVVSNATLQWVPGHLELLPALIARTSWLAFQVPGNFGEPSHTIRAELAAGPDYAPYLAGIEVPSSHDPAVYLETVADAGAQVDAWETTYLHVLTGPDPVFTWVSATGARPTLAALPDELRPRFEAEYKERLRAAYPERGGRVILPFRRIFCVARRAER